MARSVMKHQFSQVPTVKTPRSSFNRTHGFKTTFDAGLLIPFFVDEVLPGDTFKVQATLFARLLSALQVPVMDNLFLDTHFFFVPNRLVWNNFQKFMGEQENPGDSTDFLVPQVFTDFNDFASYSQSIYDYFGIPFTESGDDSLPINSLAFRAYNLIWNEWFRDENLQDSVDVPKGDGPDNISDFKILRRGKRHDYFTSALPWPQKGPSVEIPLGQFADVVTNSLQPEMNPLSGAAFADPKIVYTGPEGVRVGSNPTVAGQALKWGDETGLRADLSNATSVDINSLRLSVQMQRFLEKDARGGTRYTEILRNHFGVISPDARLQRPEYLGGHSVPISISTVPQTSASETQPTPQGNLSAFGLVSSPRNSFTKSFVEHGHVIGLVSVRADLTYQQGLPRMFSRHTKYDFYWPVFAHLGEQAVLNKEIFWAGDETQGQAVFGYQERYAEYRYYPSKITGKLRSQDPQSLDVWHLSQYFENLPLLNDEFIEEHPPVKRILAVVDEPDFVLDCYIQNLTTRAMPVYSVPGLMDHF